MASSLTTELSALCSAAGRPIREMLEKDRGTEESKPWIPFDMNKYDETRKVVKKLKEVISVRVRGQRANTNCID